MIPGTSLNVQCVQGFDLILLDGLKPWRVCSRREQGVSKLRYHGAGADPVITLGVLTAVEENSAITQRSVASELGIALGLTNSYLKHCVRKGYIKVSQIPRRRYAYYLTPQGFAEKSRLTAEFLSQSFHFFREARAQCIQALETCARIGRKRIALVGAGELCEIACLCSRDIAVNIIGIVDHHGVQGRVANLDVVTDLEVLGAIDAVVLTDLKTPQDSYFRLVARWPADRIMVPRLLNVSTGRLPESAA